MWIFQNDKYKKYISIRSTLVERWKRFYSYGITKKQTVPQKYRCMKRHGFDKSCVDRCSDSKRVRIFIKYFSVKRMVATDRELSSLEPTAREFLYLLTSHRPPNTDNDLYLNKITVISFKIIKYIINIIITKQYIFVKLQL